MRELARYNRPFIKHPLVSFIEEIEKSLLPREYFERENNFSKLSFPIKVSENDKEYLITAEIPGVNKEDINIEVNEGNITISYKKEMKKEEKNDKVHFSYIEYGEFSESINFNNKEVDFDNIEAKYENGVLTIKLPKIQENTKIKKITIK